MNWDDVTNFKGPPTGAGQALPARDQAYLIVIGGPGMGEMFKIVQDQSGDRTVIGRGATAQFRIMDDGLSREHCEIVADDGKFVLHDRGSTNGTFCRGRRVADEIVVLEDGDKILIGSGTVLKFTFHDRLDEAFQRQMYESALRDDLTQTFNKKYFQDRIESEFAFSARHGQPLALVTFDIDHFKMVNDTHGHPAGDVVLRGVAAAVIGTIRVEDVLARVGGEEFALICRGADLAQALIVGERLRAAVARHISMFDEKSIPVTISVGAASVPNPGLKDTAALIEAADNALYDAKHGGRNRVCVWYPRP